MISVLACPSSCRCVLLVPPAAGTITWPACGRQFAGERSAPLPVFFIAVLIGVGATLAWQSYGDVAREMVAARVPTLAWLLPVSATNSPVAAAVSPNSVQQLEPLASNLDVVRRSVEQLAAKQDQMAENIVLLQAVDEDIRPKMSSTPPPPAQQAVFSQQPKPQQPRTQPAPVPRAPPAAAQLSR